ncbi:glycosyltransferase family 4 protein [Alcanivorax sp.]|uniref:glycosyltransferase family 4 protein n=1 Tax=Alcanivorax sp. TaxID=1872427 RepID=UPI00258356AB|nr:glycosyltransferase family 4 protein [Alcanivorax sp.]
MSKTADILFVAPFNHDHGTERITSHVIRLASTKYERIALVYSGGHGDLFKSAAASVEMVFSLGNQDRRANVFRNALYITAKACILRPRVVFAVNPVMGMSVGLALKLLPDPFRPFSILAHHVFPRQRNDPVETKRMMEYFPMFDRHVVVSPAMIGGLMPYIGGKLDRVTCIPNAIDAAAIRRDVRAGAVNMNLPDHDWRCLYVGGLRTDKRVDRLIRAFALLPERKRTVLFLVGDGNARTRLEHLAKDLGVAERCIFVGHQARPFQWARDCDLFVQTPDWETFGLSVLEAMSAGLPVLTMGDNSPGLQDLVRDGINGRLIASGDIGEFALAWSDLLNSPEQRKLIVQQGNETVRHYSLDKMCARYMRLLSI